MMFNILVAITELNSLGLALGHLSFNNIIQTCNAFKMGSAEHKLFNFAEVFKYAMKYQASKLDSKIPVEQNDKTVDCKTDTRCFGNLLAILYQRFSPNLENQQISQGFITNLQSDPEYSIIEKDLIVGCNESQKSERPDIKDIILHEKFLKILLQNRDAQNKLTATLQYTKGLDYRNLETKLRQISAEQAKTANPFKGNRTSLVISNTPLSMTRIRSISAKDGNLNSSSKQLLNNGSTLSR